MKQAVIGLLFLILLPGELLSQVKTTFSGDPSKYKAELTAFMGPNLNEIQKANLNSFLAKWDSAAFTDEIRYRILDLTSQLQGRAMRPVPHFNDFIGAVNSFIDRNAGSEKLEIWLTGLSETVFNPRLNNDNIDRLFRNTILMIKDNILSETSSFKWKVKNASLGFKHDTALYVEIKNATLTCYAQRDSTEIYNVTGTYFPETQMFYGTKGKVTWEKAGYNPDEVFAETDNYIINTGKNNFTIDSARMTHKVYFKTPVKGVLSDQAISIRNKETANFPRFEAYMNEFRLDNVYKGVNYEGGLAIEGATVKGTGTTKIR